MQNALETNENKPNHNKMEKENAMPAPRQCQKKQNKKDICIHTLDAPSALEWWPYQETRNKRGVAS